MPPNSSPITWKQESPCWTSDMLCISPLGREIGKAATPLTNAHLWGLLLPRLPTKTLTQGGFISWNSSPYGDPLCKHQNAIACHRQFFLYRNLMYLLTRWLFQNTWSPALVTMFPSLFSVERSSPSSRQHLVSLFGPHWLTSLWVLGHATRALSWILGGGGHKMDLRLHSKLVQV